MWAGVRGGRQQTCADTKEVLASSRCGRKDRAAWMARSRCAVIIVSPVLHHVTPLPLHHTHTHTRPFKGSRSRHVAICHLSSVVCRLSCHLLSIGLPSIYHCHLSIIAHCSTEIFASRYASSRYACICSPSGRMGHCLKESTELSLCQRGAARAGTFVK